jgi:Phage integrase, N-terminal SAM-like domain
MARKVGQIIARGHRRWLIRVYLGRDLEGAKITLNEYLDRWLETAVRPRGRAKTFQDYQGMLQRDVRPVLGERVLAALRPLDLQTVY